MLIQEPWAGDSLKELSEGKRAVQRRLGGLWRGGGAATNDVGPEVATPEGGFNTKDRRKPRRKAGVKRGKNEWARSEKDLNEEAKKKPRGPTRVHLGLGKESEAPEA